MFSIKGSLAGDYYPYTYKFPKDSQFYGISITFRQSPTDTFDKLVDEHSEAVNDAGCPNAKAFIFYACFGVVEDDKREAVNKWISGKLDTDRVAFFALRDNIEASFLKYHIGSYRENDTEFVLDNTMIANGFPTVMKAEITKQITAVNNGLPDYKALEELGKSQAS